MCISIYLKYKVLIFDFSCYIYSFIFVRFFCLWLGLYAATVSYVRVCVSISTYSDDYRAIAVIYTNTCIHLSCFMCSR